MNPSKYIVGLIVLSALPVLSGCGTPSFLITPVANVNELKEESLAPGYGGKIAVIPIEGTLMDVRSGGFLEAQENPLSLFVQELDKAARDDSVKAVVLRVNSPGGSVTTSDIMYRDLLEFKAKTHKPVVASAQEVCASGAYYVSCGADKIVANPTSLVGSIGVIFEAFDLQGTLAKLGVDVHPVKSAELKDIGSPFRHPTTREVAVMQSMVDEDFNLFKSIVRANRPIKDDAAIDAVSDGRVFNGTRALQLGLIDQPGRLEDAIDLARQMAKAPHAEVVMYIRPFGYSGSIYAAAPTPPPEAGVMNIKLPPLQPFLPSGFYYLWEP